MEAVIAACIVFVSLTPGRKSYPGIKLVAFSRRADGSIFGDKCLLTCMVSLPCASK